MSKHAKDILGVTTLYYTYFLGGIKRIWDLVVNWGFFLKSGSWWSCNGVRWLTGKRYVTLLSAGVYTDKTVLNARKCRTSNILSKRRIVLRYSGLRAYAFIRQTFFTFLSVVLNFVNKLILLFLCSTTSIGRWYFAGFIWRCTSRRLDSHKRFYQKLCKPIP